MLRQRRARQARADALDIWLYIAEDNLTAADRLVDRFDDAVAMLTHHPYAGRQRPELGAEIRSFPVESYVIFYRVTDRDAGASHPERLPRSGDGLFDDEP